jgi:integrase
MLQVSSPGPLPELTSPTTGDYLESWLSQVRGRVRGRTYSGYAGLLRRYAIPLLGEVPLNDLHPLHLQHLYGQLLEQGAGGYRDQLSASTVLNLHRVLVQSLGWAERFGLLERSPAKAARPPRPRRAEPKVVDPALAERILEASSGTRLELPVAFALATGMRRGEILGYCKSIVGVSFLDDTQARTVDEDRSISSGRVETRRGRRHGSPPTIRRPWTSGTM